MADYQCRKPYGTSAAVTVKTRSFNPKKESGLNEQNGKYY